MRLFDSFMGSPTPAPIRPGRKLKVNSKTLGPSAPIETGSPGTWLYDRLETSL